MKAKVKTRCKHEHTRASNPIPFLHAVGPWEKRKPAAHGGCALVETCTQCGSFRVVNKNGSFQEVGSWRK